MQESRFRWGVLIGAVVVSLLQILVAPYIAIFGTIPNFMMIFVVIRAIVQAQSAGYIAPFVLGLLFDLMGGGPVGALALLFVAITFVLSSMFSVLDIEHPFMPMALLLLSILLVNFIYGVFFALVSGGVSVFDMFIFRTLPTTLYTAVLALIVYPFASRILRGGQTSRSTGPLYIQ